MSNVKWNKPTLNPNTGKITVTGTNKHGERFEGTAASLGAAKKHAKNNGPVNASPKPMSVPKALEGLSPEILQALVAFVQKNGNAEPAPTQAPTKPTASKPAEKKPEGPSLAYANAITQSWQASRAKQKAGELSNNPVEFKLHVDKEMVSRGFDPHYAVSKKDLNTFKPKREVSRLNKAVKKVISHYNKEARKAA